MKKTNKRIQTDTVTRMVHLAQQGYNCSQILMRMDLENQGKQNPDLVKSMTGLGAGCGFFNETCGAMTGAAVILSSYAGKGEDGQKASTDLLFMMQDLGEWFQKEIGEKYRGTRCKDIVGDLVETDKGRQICGAVVFQTHHKINEILETYGYRKHESSDRTN